MFRNIVVATDGSSTANRGIKTAVGLAREQNAVLHVVHVLEPVQIQFDESGLYIPEEYVKRIVEAQREAGRKLLAKAEALARKQGVTVQAVLVRCDGTVAHAILREARKLDADLIVLGTHGRRGLSRLVTGSDAEALLRESTVPVLLVRDPSPRERRTRRTTQARKPAKTATGKVARSHRLMPDAPPWL